MDCHNYRGRPSPNSKKNRGARLADVSDDSLQAIDPSSTSSFELCPSASPTFGTLLTPSVAGPSKAVVAKDCVPDRGAAPAPPPPALDRLPHAIERNLRTSRLSCSGTISLPGFVRVRDCSWPKSAPTTARCGEHETIVRSRVSWRSCPSSVPLFSATLQQ